MDYSFGNEWWITGLVDQNFKNSWWIPPKTRRWRELNIEHLVRNPMVSYRCPPNSYFPKVGVSHDSFFVFCCYQSIPRQRKLLLCEYENVLRSYKKKRRKKLTLTKKTSYSQDRIHQKLVAPFSTKTYWVSHKNQYKNTRTQISSIQGRLLRVRDRTYCVRFTLMPFRRHPQRAAQDLTHEKNVAPVSTKTYCVSTRKKKK